MLDVGEVVVTIEYIGNKAQVVSRLWSSMAAHLDRPPSTFADLFCGTASVSSFMRAKGYKVAANDTLRLCTTFAEATLLSEVPPEFDGLTRAGVVGGQKSGRYLKLLGQLNVTPSLEGFMFRTYSPASEAHAGASRMYFTERNAAKIDGIRNQIRLWQPFLSPAEHALLLVDLVKATNRVSNIAGTYGCYLKEWKARALDEVALRPSELALGGPIGEVHRLDASQFAHKLGADVVYADPPYTKRQYAAYYHVLETLVVGDEPAVTGSTGLRPWENESSDYCYRRKAPAALRNLVRGIPGTPDFFLSYNEDGQISHEEILEILGERGAVSVHEFQLRRYKSSRRVHKGEHVLERLYHVRMAAA